MHILAFALCTSVLEVLTASVIVIFAQVLTQPESVQRYLIKLGFTEALPPGRAILYVSFAFGAIYLVKNLVAAAEVFYQNLTIQKMNYHFKNKLLNRFSQTDYNYYLTRNSSYGLAVVGGDVELSFTSGMVSLSSIISESIVFFVLVSMVVYLNPSLAIFIFAISCGIALFVAKCLFPLFYSWGLRLQDASLLAGQNLLQFFHGFKEIILFGKREDFIESYQIHSRKNSKIRAIQTSVNVLPRITIEVLFVGLFIAVISYLCLEKDTPQQMVGILGGYLYLGFRLMPGLNRIISQLNNFKAIIPAIERVHKEYTSEMTNTSYAYTPNLTFKKNIIFTDVSFRYLNTKKNTLENVTFVIQRGENIGIVGETGSGKSTLVDLMLGLLQPKTGAILIDGKYPVCSVQWHQLIGYVPQSVYLIDDTIEKNIAFGEKVEAINQERLGQAINAAQLRTFINKLPEGTKTLVGERGVRLSGGERQRISIARALYRNPEVLIFDEATSALDNETEARLMETIHSISKSRTVIMISHRLSTLENCDRIININKGIVESISSSNARKIVHPIKH